MDATSTIRTTLGVADQVAHAAATTRAPARSVAVSSLAPRPPLDPDAAAAIALLGPGPLRPSGALRDALLAARLPRTGDPRRLDAFERHLRTGAIDQASADRIGTGLNGDRHRLRITSPEIGETWAVRKPAMAQAAQEELGWRMARALGIDHLVPTTVRRADGTAWIDFRAGTELSRSGVTDTARLEQALVRGNLVDPSLNLSPAEAAQAGIIERQLLSALDYVLANNDRHPGNGLFDAQRGALTFLDFGHTGRGARAPGASALEPELKMFQSPDAGPLRRVELDPVVVEHLRRTVDPDRIRSIHASVFDDVQLPQLREGTLGARFDADVRSQTFREDMVTRLEHVLDTGGYTHRPYSGAGNDLPPMQEAHPRAAARGFGPIGGFGGGGLGRF